MNPNNSNPYGHYQQNKQPNQGPYPNNQNQMYNQMPNQSNPYQNPGFSNPYPNQNYQQPYPPYPQMGMQPNPMMNNPGFSNPMMNNNQGYPNPMMNNQPGFSNPMMNNQPGFSNPMMNNNPGLGFGNQSFAMQIINNYADSIFDKHDQNRSGKLDVREIYPAVSELFVTNNMPPPNYNQVINIMKQFDNNGDGLIDKNEFRQLLMRLTS